MTNLAMNLEFKEEQKFTQWWLWLILFGVGLIPIYGFFIQFIKGENFGDNPMSDTGLVFFTIFIFANTALVLIMRLKTEIVDKEIRMKLDNILANTFAEVLDEYLDDGLLSEKEENRLEEYMEHFHLTLEILDERDLLGRTLRASVIRKLRLKYLFLLFSVLTAPCEKQQSL